LKSYTPGALPVAQEIITKQKFKMLEIFTNGNTGSPPYDTFGG
jgi:hypothetical protein